MAAPLPSVGQLFGRYRVLGMVGHGGMGIVFRAHDDRLQRDVAIKVLPAGALSDQAMRDRFRHEAQTLSKLNHPNIASVFDFDVYEGADFIVMELIPGVPLNSHIKGRPLPESDVLSFGVQIANGLEEAHEHGIVHRDLKPGNIIITPKSQLKILDFGLARLTRVSDLDPTATATNQKGAGTLPYMAPEQLRGAGVDLRSDLWAAGVILYEMATGRHPFGRDQIGGLVEAILHDEPAAPRTLNPDLSPSCESLILQALDKDPARRFQTAGELRRALEHLRNPSTVGTYARTDTHPITPSEKRRNVQTIGMAAGVLLLVALLAAIPALRRRLGPATPILPANKLVAVLPFKNIGNDAEMNAFGEGLTETLSSKLGQFTEKHALQVIPTQEILATASTTTEKARANFGVNLVVEGSLQKIGSTVRINCHLVDAATRRMLHAADTITASSGDAFALEDQVVTEVLKLLAINLGPQERLDLQRRGTTQPAAYDYYLRARGYMQDYHKQDNINLAMAAYKRAIELDPKFALAYAGIGEAYWRNFQESHDAKYVELATTTCQKAIALAEQSAEGHYCLGRVNTLTGDPQKAAEQFELAIVLDPNSDEGYRGLAEAYSGMGKLQNAEATFRRAISLRPQYWAGYSWLGQFYFRQSRYDEADQMFRKVLELSPDNFRAYSNLGGIHAVQGKYEEAIVESQKSIAIRPNLNAYLSLGTAYFGLRRYADAASTYEQGLKLDPKSYTNWGNLGDARYWTPGLRAKAPEAYTKAIELAGKKLQVTPRDETALSLQATYYAMLDNKPAALASLKRALAVNPQDADVRFRAALVYNHFGDTDQTLKWIAKALEAGYPPKSIRDTPDFEGLKSDAKFKRLANSKD